MALGGLFFFILFLVTYFFPEMVALGPKLKNKILGFHTGTRINSSNKIIHYWFRIDYPNTLPILRYCMTVSDVSDLNSTDKFLKTKSYILYSLLRQLGDISASEYQNLKFLVPTPHNTLLIMVGRTMNCKASMIRSQDIAKTWFVIMGFY